MLISNLIEKLQKLKEENWDIQVCIVSESTSDYITTNREEVTLVTTALSDVTNKWDQIVIINSLH